ncbi:MAG: hypothetical protein M3Y25_06375, partial [Thermoproteota archaeon]|nr:hypothetical protein [Thermoproteota archaeon]
VKYSYIYIWIHCLTATVVIIITIKDKHSFVISVDAITLTTIRIFFILLYDGILSFIFKIRCISDS